MCVLAQKRGIASHCLDHGARLGAWGKAGEEEKRSCRGGTGTGIGKETGSATGNPVRGSKSAPNNWALGGEVVGSDVF